MRDTPSRLRAWLGATVLAGALALGLMLLAPAPRLQASTCGGPGAVLCKETTACAGWLWGRICTTTYDYWSDSAIRPTAG